MVQMAQANRDQCKTCPVKLHVENGHCPLSLCLFNAYEFVLWHLDVRTLVLWDMGWPIERIIEETGDNYNNARTKIVNWRDKKRKAGILV